MELWIRSQDKTALIKTEDIRLYYMKANAPENATEIWLKDRNVPVGIYKSKERALEVLDEIQKHITINATITGNYEEQDTTIKSLMLGYQIKIFEMPEK